MHLHRIRCFLLRVFWNLLAPRTKSRAFLKVHEAYFPDVMAKDLAALADAPYKAYLSQAESIQDDIGTFERVVQVDEYEFVDHEGL